MGGDKVEVTERFNSGRNAGSTGKVVAVNATTGGMTIKWDDTPKSQRLGKSVLRKIRKIPGRRRLAATPPVCPSLPMLTDMSPCVSTSVVLLVILPLLYLLYVLVVRRTRAPKRRRSSRTAT